MLQEDLIGLREIDAKDGLIFDELDGHHMQFSEEELIHKIIRPYLQSSMKQHQTPLLVQQ